MIGAQTNHIANETSRIFCLRGVVRIARSGNPEMDAAPKNQKDDVSIFTPGEQFLIACSHEFMSLAPQAVINSPSKAKSDKTVTA